MPTRPFLWQPLLLDRLPQFVCGACLLFALFRACLQFPDAFEDSTSYLENSSRFLGVVKWQTVSIIAWILATALAHPRFRHVRIPLDATFAVTWVISLFYLIPLFHSDATSTTFTLADQSRATLFLTLESIATACWLSGLFRALQRYRTPASPAFQT